MLNLNVVVLLDTGYGRDFGINLQLYDLRRAFSVCLSEVDPDISDSTPMDIPFASAYGSS
jgi:hypothetical protein